MLIQTKAYGPKEIDDRQLVEFPSGLLGFENLRKFALLDSSQPPFLYLQSIDDPDINFVLLSPEVFRPDFKLDIAPGDLEELRIGENEDLLVLAIVTIPGEGQPITANLQGPLVFNRQKHLAKQCIQLGSAWKTKHNIIEEMSAQGVN